MNQQNKNGLEDLTESSGTIKSISKGGYENTYFVSLSFVNDSGEVSVVRFEYHHQEEADTLYHCLESYWGNTKEKKGIKSSISAKHVKGNLYEGIKLRILEKNGSTE